MSDKKGVTHYTIEENKKVNEKIVDLLKTIQNVVMDKGDKMGQGNNPCWFIMNFQLSVLRVIETMIKHQTDFVLAFTDSVNRDAEKYKDNTPRVGG